MGNIFGGANQHGLYIPMSDVESEALQRLAESGDLQIVISKWGVVRNFKKITIGDARLGLEFKVSFKSPAIAVPVEYFDLDLQLASSGTSIYKSRLPINLGFDRKLYVMEGLELDLAWDIQIKHLDPNLVKELKPHAFGLTSRLQDKDSGDFTDTGNMKMNRKQLKSLERIKEGERSVKAERDTELKKVKDSNANIRITE